MKTLKKILLVVAIIIAIPLIVALFVKNEYAVERKIVINRPKGEVFNYLKHLKNQDNYSKWVRMDPNMKKDYKGTDGTVGFTSYWDSEKSDVVEYLKSLGDAPVSSTDMTPTPKSDDKEDND